MKAFYGNKLLVETSIEELQIIKIAVEQLINIAVQERDNSEQSEELTRDIDNYVQLDADVEEILNSIPF